MIEVGKLYSKPEMTAMLGTKARQGIDRKLERYGIVFEATGRGEKATYKINAIPDPFKLYAITKLKCDGNTNFHKLREFYYYFFNDEEFSAMPDEVKENRLRADGKDISRQTIAGYLAKLDKQELILRNTYNYIYYFAYKNTQTIVERPIYSQAWKEYWTDFNNGLDYWDRISNMISNYGGIAHKQAIPEINGIYKDEIDYMLSLIQQSMENELPN